MLLRLGMLLHLWLSMLLNLWLCMLLHLWLSMLLHLWLGVLLHLRLSMLLHLRLSMLLHLRLGVLLHLRLCMLLHLRLCMLLHLWLSMLLHLRLSMLLDLRLCVLLHLRLSMLLRRWLSMLLDLRLCVLLRRWLSMLLDLRLCVLLRCGLILSDPGGRCPVCRAQRLFGNQVLRMAPIRLGIQAPVGPGSHHVLRLVAGRSYMPLTRGSQFLGRGGVLYATRTAAVGNVAVVHDRVSLHNRPVDVGGVNDGLIHAHDRGVVGKLVAAPLAAGEADPPVAKAVVDASVIAYVPTPIATMEPIVAAEPAPIVGCPQRTLIRSHHPGAGHPVVVSIAPGPVARCPHQVGFGAQGLLVNRQLRWGKIDAEEDLGVQIRRYHRHQQRKHE